MVTSDMAQDAEVIGVAGWAAMSAAAAEQLKAGSNVIDMPDMLSDGGTHQYQVTVVPQNRGERHVCGQQHGRMRSRRWMRRGRCCWCAGNRAIRRICTMRWRRRGIQVVKTHGGGIAGGA